MVKQIPLGFPLLLRFSTDQQIPMHFGRGFEIYMESRDYSSAELLWAEVNGGLDEEYQQEVDALKKPAMLKHIIEPIPPIFARHLPETLRMEWSETRSALFQIGKLTGNEADLWAWRIVHRNLTPEIVGKKGTTDAQSED